MLVPIFPAVQKCIVPRKPFLSQNGIKGRRNYLRTHLVDRCSEYIKVKQRCPQTQFTALMASCWLVEILRWFLGKELGEATPGAGGGG